MSYPRLSAYCADDQRLAFQVKDGEVPGGTLTQRGQRMNVFRRE